MAGPNDARTRRRRDRRIERLHREFHYMAEVIKKVVLNKGKRSMAIEFLLLSHRKALEGVTKAGYWHE